MRYEETRYDEQVAVRGRADVRPAIRRVSVTPSPARSDLRIAFSLAAPARVSVRMYDAAGRKVKTLLDAVQSAGKTVLAWDRGDDLGRRLGSGTYFCRIAVGNRQRTLKVVLAE